MNEPLTSPIDMLTSKRAREDKLEKIMKGHIHEHPSIVTQVGFAPPSSPPPPTLPSIRISPDYTQINSNNNTNHINNSNTNTNGDFTTVNTNTSSQNNIPSLRVPPSNSSTTTTSFNSPSSSHSVAATTATPSSSLSPLPSPSSGSLSPTTTSPPPPLDSPTFTPSQEANARTNYHSPNSIDSNAVTRHLDMMDGEDEKEEEKEEDTPAFEPGTNDFQPQQQEANGNKIKEESPANALPPSLSLPLPSLSPSDQRKRKPPDTQTPPRLSRLNINNSNTPTSSGAKSDRSEGGGKRSKVNNTKNGLTDAFTSSTTATPFNIFQPSALNGVSSNVSDSDNVMRDGDGNGTMEPVKQTRNLLSYFMPTSKTDSSGSSNEDVSIIDRPNTLLRRSSLLSQPNSPTSQSNPPPTTDNPPAPIKAKREKKEIVAPLLSNEQRKQKELQEYLEKKEFEMKEKERILIEKEKELESRIYNIGLTQTHIDDLNLQLKEKEEQNKQYQEYVKQSLPPLIYQLHDHMTKLATQTYLSTCSALGSLQPYRDGHVWSEQWVDGEEMKRVKRRLEEVIEECKRIEGEKKKITNKRNAIKRQKDKLQQLQQGVNINTTTFLSGSMEEKGEESNSNHANNTASSHNNNTNEEFKKPLPVPTYQELFEIEERYSIQLVALKKEQLLLEDTKRELESKRKQHIRVQKLRQDELNSRFHNYNKILENRYILTHMIGKGGFSEVYKAYDLQEMRWVACKIHQLNPSWPEERRLNYTKHATREYNIHRSLLHPHVVSLIDAFAIDTHSFASVLEYCDGSDLDMYLKVKGTLSEREARCIIMQVFNGLQYFNEQKQKIIHYDLKPGNILFHQNQVKITDFGLSKLIESASESEGGGIELTSQGAGTYWYLPPECFPAGGENSFGSSSENSTTHLLSNNSNRHLLMPPPGAHHSQPLPTSTPRLITPAVDIFSAGVILYQMLVGQKPFGHGLTAHALVTHNTMATANVGKLQWPMDKSGKFLLQNVTMDFIKDCLSVRPQDRPEISKIFEWPYFKASLK